LVGFLLVEAVIPSADYETDNQGFTPEALVCISNENGKLTFLTFDAHPGNWRETLILFCSFLLALTDQLYFCNTTPFPKHNG
jgi:hypothetical protein